MKKNKQKPIELPDNKPKFQMLAIEEIKMRGLYSCHLCQAAKLLPSVKKYGLMSAILVDKEFVVVVGHARLLAAHMLDIERVPVLILYRHSPEEIERLRHYDFQDYEVDDNKNWLEEFKETMEDFNARVAAENKRRWREVRGLPV